MPLTAPMNDWAPIWLAAAPIWTDVMTPNGIETRIVGSSDTRVMNQHWSRNSDHENRRATMSVAMNLADSTERITRSPVVLIPAFARPTTLSKTDRPPRVIAVIAAPQQPRRERARQASPVPCATPVARFDAQAQCLLLGVTDITRKRHTVGRCPRSDAR